MDRSSAKKALLCVLVVCIAVLQHAAADCPSRTSCNICVSKSAATSAATHPERCIWCADLPEGQRCQPESQEKTDCDSSWRTASKPQDGEGFSGEFCDDADAISTLKADDLAKPKPTMPVAASDPSPGALSPLPAPVKTSTFHPFPLLRGRAGRTGDFVTVDVHKEITDNLSPIPMLADAAKATVAKYPNVNVPEVRNCFWTASVDKNCNLLLMEKLTKLYGFRSEELEKDPPAEFLGFLADSKRGIQFRNAVRPPKFPYKVLLRILELLPDEFYRLENGKGQRMFQTLALDHSRSLEVASYSIDGESTKSLGDGKGFLMIHPNAWSNRPAFVHVIVHELGHNWEKSLRRTKPAIYQQMVSHAQSLQSVFPYVYPMAPGDREGRMKYLFAAENEPLAETFMLYVAHGQRLRSFIARLKKSRRAERNSKYDAFRAIYEQIKSDLGGREYCSRFEGSKSSRYGVDPVRCRTIDAMLA